MKLASLNRLPEKYSDHEIEYINDFAKFKARIDQVLAEQDARLDRVDPTEEGVEDDV